MPSQPPSLSPRRQPAQERGRATVERLLDATAAILDEEGFEAATTNAIAARAQVNVASLYKYFPNKYALIGALAERNQERQREVIGRVIGEAADFADWQQAIDRGIDAFVEHFLKEPGFSGVSAAIAATPALQELSTSGIPSIAAIIEAGIREQARPERKRDAKAIARIVAEVGAAALDAAREATPRERKALVRELKTLLFAYLGPVFEADAAED